jgi:hypothetical protein
MAPQLNLEAERAEFEAQLPPGWRRGRFIDENGKDVYMMSEVQLLFTGWLMARNVSAEIPGAIRLARVPGHQWFEVSEEIEPILTAQGVHEMATAYLVDPASLTVVASQPDGMPATQEPKYGIRDNQLFNRASNEHIPLDEPVFILRARDMRAGQAMSYYMALFEPGDHRVAVESRLRDFAMFASAHPDRMKWPDTVPFPATSNRWTPGGAA